MVSCSSAGAALMPILMSYDKGYAENGVGAAVQRSLKLLVVSYLRTVRWRGGNVANGYDYGFAGN